MKVSLSWLKTYVPVEMKVADLADALTMAGLEVDSLTDRFDYLNTVVVSRVTAVSPHPNADKLRLCKVDTGSRTLDVVCGAPNVRESMLVPCALQGTTLPDGTVIREGVIRKAVSEAMLCSAIELGLGPDAAGIMELDEHQTVGTPLNKALDLSDPVIEIDLTPNRPDCLSIIGIAREAAAIQGKTISRPEIHLEEAGGSIADHTSVSVLNPELCPRYAARLLLDVTVGPSPFWLQDRLTSVGLKPINNIVDITNFVMMETGQPLHAFDFDRLAGNKIVVRTPKPGETLTTLDGKPRQLDPEMLMICDAERPVAIGGVMGGENSEIEPDTTRVLLESACFDPISIRKTAKKLGLGTDASHRFERGVDPDGTRFAIDRAAQLIAEIAGGTLVSGTIDEDARPAGNRQIPLNIRDLNRRLGTGLDAASVSNYLSAIEFRVRQQSDEVLMVEPPSFRVDVSRFEDLSEEVARLYGYNNIATTFPAIPAEAVTRSAPLAAREQIRNLLTGFGFNEAITYSFVNPLSGDRLQLKADDPRRRTVPLLNPLSEDQAVMRTTLAPGLLETMKRNLSVQNRTLRLFEMGKVFFKADRDDAQPDEQEMLAGLWTGNRVDASWLSKEIPCEFFDLKGVVEGLLVALDIADIAFTRLLPEHCDYTRPGYSARILAGGREIGIIGEIHPAVLKSYDLKQTAYMFELNLDNVTPLIPRKKTARPIPKFPSTSRDVTLIVDTETETQSILNNIERQNEELVESLILFDVYEGEPIPAGRKSISFRITYRSLTETLEDERVNTLHQTISSRLIKEFNATLPA